MLNINSLRVVKENDMLTDEQRDQMLANRPAKTLSRDEVAAKIVAMGFWKPFEQSTTTICVIRFGNGWEVTGESSCLHPDNFDAELGKKIAYDNAVDKAIQFD